VVFELSCVEKGLTVTFLDKKTIDPDLPIAHYRQRFGGVSGISVFSEREEEDRKRLAIPNSYSVPKLGAQTTSRQLANAVLRIFENARTWA
jgi:hypothetical protein